MTLREPSSLLRIEDLPLPKIFSSQEIAANWNTKTVSFDNLGIPDSTGGVNPGDRRALYYICRYLRCSSVLEIGTHIGASTVHLAAAISETCKETGAVPKLVTVDIRDVNDPISKPWLKRRSRFSPQEALDQLGLSQVVLFMKNKSTNYLRGCDCKYDLIFLDGDHGRKTVYQELPLVLKLLNEGGIVVLHDYYPDGKRIWPERKAMSGPFKATEQLKAEGLGIQILPASPLPWPTKLGTNQTSLAFVCRP